MEILKRINQTLDTKQIEITSGWDQHEIDKLTSLGLELTHIPSVESKYFFYDPKSEIYIEKLIDGKYCLFVLDGDKKVEILNEYTSDEPKGNYISITQVFKILDNAPKIIEKNHKWHKFIENKKNRPKMSNVEVIADIKSQFEKLVYGQYRIAARPIKYTYDSKQSLIIDGIYHNIESLNSSEAKYSKNGTCYNWCYLFHEKYIKEYPQYNWYFMLCNESRFFESGSHYVLIGSKEEIHKIRNNEINTNSNKEIKAYSRDIKGNIYNCYFSRDSIFADPSFGFVSTLEEAIDGVDDNGFEVKYSIKGTCFGPSDKPIFFKNLTLDLNEHGPIGFLDEAKNQLLHIRNNGPEKPVSFLVQTKGQSYRHYEWESLELQKLLINHPIWKNLRKGLAKNFNLINPDELDNQLTKIVEKV